jgi:MFS family permease
MAVFAIANDFTALTVVLPDIEAEFDSDVSSVQWVINAYALMFGVLIVTGGRLADMFGRRWSRSRPLAAGCRGRARAGRSTPRPARRSR